MLTTLKYHFPINLSRAEVESKYKIFQNRNSILFLSLASLNVTRPPRDSNYAEQVFCICKPDENLWEQNLSHQKKKKKRKEVCEFYV